MEEERGVFDFQALIKKEKEEAKKLAQGVKSG